MNRRPRAPRKDVNAPAIVRSDDADFDAELRDISDTGAAIEFELTAGITESFDIGHSVELSVKNEDRQSGRVIRHYEGGFAMKFDD